MPSCLCSQITRELKPPRQPSRSLPAPPGHPLGSLEGSCSRSGEPPWRNLCSAKASADRRGAQSPLDSVWTYARSSQVSFQLVWSKWPIPSKPVQPDLRYPTFEPLPPKHGTGLTKKLNQNQISAAWCSQSRAAISAHGTAVPASPILADRAQGLLGSYSPPGCYRGHRSSVGHCSMQSSAKPTTIWSWL